MKNVTKEPEPIATPVVLPEKTSALIRSGVESFEAIIGGGKAKVNENEWVSCADGFNECSFAGATMMHRYGIVAQPGDRVTLEKSSDRLGGPIKWGDYIRILALNNFALNLSTWAFRELGFTHLDRPLPKVPPTSSFKKFCHAMREVADVIQSDEEAHEASIKAALEKRKVAA